MPLADPTPSFSISPQFLEGMVLKSRDLCGTEPFLAGGIPESVPTQAKRRLEWGTRRLVRTILYRYIPSWQAKKSRIK